MEVVFLFHPLYKIIFRDKNARPGFVSGKIFLSLVRKRIFPESLALFIATYFGGIADEKKKIFKLSLMKWAI